MIAQSFALGKQNRRTGFDFRQEGLGEFTGFDPFQGFFHAFFHIRSDDLRTVVIFAEFGGVGNNGVHLLDAAFENQVHNQFEFVDAFEVCHFRRITGFDQGFETVFHQVDAAAAEAIGFSATPTAFSELYSALQTGVVEGAENPLSGIDGNAFYEVCDYLTLDNHTYNIPVLLFSAKTWNSLTPDTQAVLKEMWEKTVNEFFVPQLSDYEAGLIKKFEEHGMTVNELTDYDKWVEAVQPVWAEFGAGLEDMIATVQATK